jgi:hypothetical protein
LSAGRIAADAKLVVLPKESYPADGGAVLSAFGSVMRTATFHASQNIAKYRNSEIGRLAVGE